MPNIYILPNSNPSHDLFPCIFLFSLPTFYLTLFIHLLLSYHISHPFIHLTLTLFFYSHTSLSPTTSIVLTHVRSYSFLSVSSSFPPTLFSFLHSFSFPLAFLLFPILSISPLNSLLHMLWSYVAWNRQFLYPIPGERQLEGRQLHFPFRKPDICLFRDSRHQYFVHFFFIFNWSVGKSVRCKTICPFSVKQRPKPRNDSFHLAQWEKKTATIINNILNNNIYPIIKKKMPWYFIGHAD